MHLERAAKADRDRRDSLVREALDSIEDPVLKRIVTMKYTDPEHTTRQIAEALDMPHGTVTVKLVRFRKRFRAALVALLGEPDV